MDREALLRSCIHPSLYWGAWSQPVIQPKNNVADSWPVDWYLYKERHLIECFFKKINDSVALRPDMTSSMLLSSLLLIWPLLPFC